MVNLKMKLKSLKNRIKSWSNEVGNRSRDSKCVIQSKQSDLDKITDQGGGNETIVNSCLSLLKELQDRNFIEALEIGQKLKFDGQ